MQSLISYLGLQGAIFLHWICNKLKMTSNGSESPDWIDSIRNLRGLAKKCTDKGEYSRAVEYLTMALKSHPGDTITRSIRSSALIHNKQFSRALGDAEMVLSQNPTHFEATLDKGRALIGLRRYNEALDFLSTYVPDKTRDDHLILDLKKRLTDELNGVYDMNYYMYHLGNGQPIYADCAEYITGPFEVLYIYGKGRAIVAAESLKAGQLIMAAKAIATCDGGSVHACQPLEKEAMLTRLTEKVLKFMERNIDLKSHVTSLYSGPILPSHDDHPNAMRLHVTNIVKYNRFMYNYKERRDGVGLWMKPSFFNHKCIETNAWHLILKDMMFVRATRDIAQGEEIVLNYIGPFMSHAERKKFFEFHNFQCDCSLCNFERVRPSKALKTRDNLIEKVVRIQPGSTLSARDLETLRRRIIKMKRLNLDEDIDFHVLSAEQKLAGQYVDMKRYLVSSFMSRKHYELAREVSVAVALKCLMKSFVALECGGLRAEMNQLTSILKEFLLLHFGNEDIDLKCLHLAII